MKSIKHIFGILGIAASVILLGAAVAAVIMNGASPLNTFYNEFGLFSGGYFVLATPLLFNLALVLFGLIFAACMVIDALAINTTRSTILGFFGALTGVLMAAQGIFTLNISQYHYIVSSAFYASAFVLCVLYIVFKFLDGGFKPSASVIVAACAGIAGAVYVWYMLSGSMSSFFVDDASLASRASLVPFALVGWGAMALFIAFTVLYSIGLLYNKNKTINAAINYIESVND